MYRVLDHKLIVKNCQSRFQKVIGNSVNGTTYAGLRARTTGAPQNHWSATSSSSSFVCDRSFVIVHPFSSSTVLNDAPNVGLVLPGTPEEPE